MRLKVNKWLYLTQKVSRNSNYKKRLRGIGVLIVLFTCLLAAYSAEEDTHVHDHDSTLASSEQTQEINDFCPVMPDMKINPDIFTDYQGKRVYFCCNNCKAAFVKNPEKYLPHLPQFGGTIIPGDHEGPHYELTLAGLIKPFGIMTLSLLALTVSTALLRRRKPKFLLKWHKRLGIITLVSAIIHFILVLVAH